MLRKRTIHTLFCLLISALVLLPVAGCVKNPSSDQNLQVGFDLDDTLVFSTLSFDKAFKSAFVPFSPDFWEVVNASDGRYSIIKKKASSLLDMHANRGDDIFIITARHPFGTAPLEDFLQKVFVIKKENIFFETEGKTPRIRALGLDVFYGDSDSDITDALSGGAVPYRIERSTTSSYKRKYNPGRFGEDIIEGSLW